MTGKAHLSRAWLGAILALFGVLGVLYSVVTPIFEASDEWWHYPVVQYIAAGHGLPVQTPPERAGLWKQEASQPPLYYALAGLLTAWVDTDDLGKVLRPNPHAAVGVVTPDGNINLVAHDPAREAWPWRGTPLAVHLARLLSVALSVTTVYLAYRLGQAAFPGRPEIALGAAALTAFTPMFVFISGSVNNDNLATPLCALALLLMIRQAEQADRAGWLATGMVIGLAILTKLNALGLLPLAALTGAWVAWQRRRWQHLAAAGLAVGLPVLALTSWWFWRNMQLYGDWLGYRMFTAYFTRAIPADLAQIWSERHSFLYGYWGNLGGLNLPIPQWAYTLLNSLLVIAGLGWLIQLGRFLITRRPATQNQPPPTQYPIPNTQYPHFPLLLIILWGLIVFVGWLGWTRTTWSSQGRLVFSALPSYSILIAAGLAAWLPRRAAPYALGGLGVGMALLAAAVPFAVIAPAYARPPQLDPAQIAAIPNRADVSFGDTLTLLGYDVSLPSSRGEVRPGDSIAITLYWQAIRSPDRDYSVFVHLLDENDITVQSKGPAYPGRGNLPATTLVPGQTWAETWVVPVGAAAYTPARLTWEVGLYDAARADGPRLTAVDNAGRALGDSVRFGQVVLARPPGISFNPVSYNLDDQLELVGFDLDRRAAAPGETVNLTLFWRALAAPARDYVIFAHVLEWPKAKWAGWDEQPQPPTSSWAPGQVISSTYPLTLDAATPPGVYDIEIGAYYPADDSGLVRLKVLTRDGRQQHDFILLTKVRVIR